MFDNLADQVYKALVVNDRWVLYIDGLLVTLMIAAIAVVLGVVIGSGVAMGKVSALNNRKFKWLGVICEIYTTVIRGTPVLVQLLIMYYVVFASAKREMAPYVAALAFGINSGAYVAEIVRAGIMAVPRGQMEAGRSLGLTNGMTMRQIIFPQAIKNILPALGNEFIILFKETSIVGYIAVTDLTRASELVRTQTYQALVPLLIIAAIYLGIVMLITWALRKLEKRLARSDVRYSA
ncbi:MAG: amino acid ABC transporter permease [Christensenellaceae bacterium]|jgi:His/Glu/Gln/Arg/opine family amino acid ABC transporter permease subunit